MRGEESKTRLEVQVCEDRRGRKSTEEGGGGRGRRKKTNEREK